jgi:hypothetical protein
MRMLRSSDLFATHFFECRFQLVWGSIHNSSRAILEMLWAASNASMAGRQKLNHEHLAVVDAQLPAARRPKEILRRKLLQLRPPRVQWKLKSAIWPKQAMEMPGYGKHGKP